MDWDLIDAGKNPITLVPGASFISHADSFALIRGGYIDVAVMGAYQVSAHGDLANWWTGDGIPAVGGAMDLAACARSVYVMMRHNERDGSPKIVKECTVPLTAPRVVTRVYTELGVFSPGDGVLIAEALVGAAISTPSVRGQPRPSSRRRRAMSCRPADTPSSGSGRLRSPRRL